MPTVMEFQKKLLTDPQARAHFAADPKKALADAGIKLPADLVVPDKLDPAFVNERLTGVKAELDHQGIDLATFDKATPDVVTRFVEEGVPLRTTDLSLAQAVHEGILQGHGGEVETAAVVAVAVVAAVVAVPVATVGMTDKFSEAVLPATGIQSITRGNFGLTVHGPGGLRVEGASVNQVAQLIRTLR